MYTVPRADPFTTTHDSLIASHVYIQLCHELPITGGTITQPGVNSHWLSQWKLFIFDLAQDRHPLTGTAEEQHIKRCDEEKEKDTFWHCSKIVTTWLFATFIISMCSR